jgi:NADH/NAD ratio-sensing transcriptional regulator Rex
MSKTTKRGPYMKTKIKCNQLSKEEMEEFMNKNCKLLSSKQLAELLQVTEGAIRKQRSKARSLFPYAKLGGRVFYPADLIVETLHKNLTQSQAR